MYHRFVMKRGKTEPDNEGAISFATGLWTSNQLPPEQDSALGELIKWFNGHLAVPSKFKQKKKREWNSRSQQVHGVFWFKDNTIHVDQGKKLIALLNQWGYRADHIVSDDPGKIEVEDKIQAVAVFNRRVKWKIVA